MDKRKVGNTKQIISAYNLELKDGAGYGKQCVLVNNGGLEVMFNADNALDIAWAKFNGVNLSFLSKNGINSNNAPFAERFEGGFLYTCGLDNVSGCESDKPIHGSLHSKKAESVRYEIFDDKVIVCGTIKNTVLFGQNLTLNREFTIYCDKIEINDTIINEGFSDAEYVLLYHINFGYPLLDSCAKIEFDEVETIPAHKWSGSAIKDCKIVTEPLDEGTEDLFYHILKDGKVSISNPEQNIKCQMEYDTNKFPFLLEWKNLFSGDYVIGLEPATTRFDEYKKIKISPQQKEQLKLTISLSKI